MRVTIKDLARELNLSPSTVSRALKNDVRISEKVSKAVQKLAKERGYQPNLLARSLVSDRSCAIGLVINDISWPIFSELSQHIQNAAEQYGYTTFLYSSDNNPKKELKGIESMIARRVDALIVFAHENVENIHFLEQMFRDGYPVVLCNDMENVELDIVTVDYTQSVTQVMDYLLELGHERIAYIGPKPVTVAEKKRLEGYEKVMKERLGRANKRLIVTGDAYPLLGYDATMQLLNSGQKPTAIVAFNDTMAVSVIRALHECHYQIPADISVVGFDGLEIGLSIYPPLTTASIPIKQMANTAMQMLIQRIEARDQDQVKQIIKPQKIRLIPQLTIRESVSKAAR
jgi:DNA-binding LacI/PurR family transcriptional regulator